MFLDNSTVKVSTYFINSICMNYKSTLEFRVSNMKRYHLNPSATNVLLEDAVLVWLLRIQNCLGYVGAYTYSGSKKIKMLCQKHGLASQVRLLHTGVYINVFSISRTFRGLQTMWARLPTSLITKVTFNRQSK